MYIEQKLNLILVVEFHDLINMKGNVFLTNKLVFGIVDPPAHVLTLSLQ